MRFLDVLFSLFALVFLAPFFAGIMLLLRFTGEGEVFYFQQRIGLNGLKFKVFKFATMLKDSPNLGSGTITSKDDNRILPIGGFLRKTKINELPQFFNVLMGEMSLIGPRPHAERDLEGISSSDLKIITSMRPGLSGVGSLVFRNEEDILSNFEDPRFFYDTVIATYKAELELWYFENRTFILNIRLILLTAYAVLFRKNIMLQGYFQNFPPVPEPLRNLL